MSELKVISQLSFKPIITKYHYGQCQIAYPFYPLKQNT